MGVYTKYDEPWIDTKLHSKLELITNLLLENIQGINSIILTGGFGRGEGSVRVVGESDIKLMKDFDLVVIVDKIPSRELQDALLDSIYRHLSLKNAEREQFRFSQFVVDIKFLKKDNLAYPDIWFYDLKSANRTLYGQSISSYIPYNAEDIPLSSGFRILFEKVTGLLANFSYKYLEGSSISKDKQDSLTYECLKTYVEIGTVLCILTKNYRPSYLERSQIIKKILNEDLRELAIDIPELAQLIEKATMFKLKPDSVDVDQDPVDMWFSTRENLGKVIKYYLSKFLNVAIDDWTNLPQLRSPLSKKYYLPLLESWIRQRPLGCFGTRFVGPVNYIYNVMLNLEYIHQIRKNGHKFYLTPLRRPVSPSLKFYLAAPLILFSLDRKGNVKSEYLELFFKELKFCIPIDQIEYSNGWESARNHYLEAYRLYSGLHLVK